MATFTEQEVTDICRVFGASSDVMAAHLDYYASLITTTDKTAILADVDAYEAIEDDNIDVDPNVKNFGAKINADRKRALIRKRIAGLLQWQDMAAGSMARLVRA